MNFKLHKYRENKKIPINLKCFQNGTYWFFFKYSTNTDYEDIKIKNCEIFRE